MREVDNRFGQFENGVLSIASNINNIVDHDIILQDLKDTIRIVVNVAESPGLLAGTVNGNGLIIQRRMHEPGDDKIRTLLRAIGIEESKNGIVQTKFFLI